MSDLHDVLDFFAWFGNAYLPIMRHWLPHYPVVQTKPAIMGIYISCDATTKSLGEPMESVYVDSLNPIRAGVQGLCPRVGTICHLSVLCGRQVRVWKLPRPKLNVGVDQWNQIDGSRFNPLARTLMRRYSQSGDRTPEDGFDDNIGDVLAVAEDGSDLTLLDISAMIDVAETLSNVGALAMSVWGLSWQRHVRKLYKSTWGDVFEQEWAAKGDGEPAAIARVVPTGCATFPCLPLESI
ncbi:hypothetical protein OQA88_7177 [Cercophora sp. LCS_1]